MAPQFFTIGYERATQAELLATLKAAGVRRVIDVRDVANSRRAGFAKRMLAASLDAEGITYLHLRALGTPKAGRQANRAGRHAEFAFIYEQAFQQPAAQLALAEAEALCREAPSALLCFCADATTCHRDRIARELVARGLMRTDLAPGV